MNKIIAQKAVSHLWYVNVFVLQVDESQSFVNGSSNGIELSNTKPKPSNNIQVHLWVSGITRSASAWRWEGDGFGARPKTAS